jgi:hypothetical protein
LGKPGFKLQFTNRYKVQTTPYGEAVAIDDLDDDLDGLTQAICLDLTKQPSQQTSAEFR